MTRSVGRLILARAAGLTLVVLASLAGPVWAADATPGAGGDPRSPGQGPGLVGDPAFALGAMLLVGLLSLALTLAYVRLTAPRRNGPQR